MSKKRIIFITALITISLVGLVAVQLFWIQNAIVVKEEQLSHNVASAMQSVVHKIETGEAVNALAQWKNIASQAEEISKQERALKRETPALAERKIKKKNKQPDYAEETEDAEEIAAEAETEWREAHNENQPRFYFNSTFPELPAPVSPPQPRAHFQWNISKNKLKLVPKKTAVKVQRNSPQAIVIENLLQQPFELEAMDEMMEDLAKQQQVLMHFTDSLHSVYFQDGNVIIHRDGRRNRTPNRTEVLGNTDSKTLRSGKTRNARNINPAEDILFKRNADAHRRVSTLTPKTEAPRIRKKTISPDTANIFKSALQQAIVSSMMKDKPISERVTKSALDSLLKKEFNVRGISIPYEFGVTKNTNDSLLITKAIDKKAIIHAPYKAALFSDDMLSSEQYSLLVNFPGQKAHILESLWLMLASSLLFILITIFSFSFTIVALVKQKKMSDIKTDFINNMTHEFKTPIATIGLASEALKEAKVLENSDKVSRFVNVIQDENKRLSKQVERVLQAALIERGDLQLTFEDVHLHDAIDHVVHNIAVQVEARGGKIECIFKAKNPLILADDVHISNVFYNLLDNATKYSPDAPDITISTRNDERGVFISVSDKGMGMTREALKQIFEKFYRVPTGNLHDVKGFGLGLSYVKAVVEAHGGTITVESEPKKGSNFEVFLPYIHNTLV